MYRTCLQCAGDLGENTLLEHLPTGRRIAFDSRQGRLWVICGKCGKWNLVPFEQRLESIDAAERLFRGTPTRFATDHIGLARHRSGVDLIRVGPALGEEFASWRYGAAFRQRRRRIRLLGAAVATPVILGSVPLYLGNAMEASSLLRSGGWVAFAALYGWSNFNSMRAVVHRFSQRIPLAHPRTGARIVLGFTELTKARIIPDDDAVNLTIPWGSADTLVFRGDAVETLTRRILGKVNAPHGSSAELRGAVAEVAYLHRKHPGLPLPAAMLQALGFGRPAEEVPLIFAPPATGLALEMYGNEETERRVLTGELHFLERQWREAEALAKIADDLLLPTPEERRAADS